MKRQNRKPHSMTLPPTARFWDYGPCGWVKFTIRPGETIRHSESHLNGEGASWSAFAITYDADNADGPRLVQEWAWGGHDCDGGFTDSGKQVATLDKLAAVPVFDMGPRAYHEGRPIMRPEWDIVEETHRDERAEAAGY